MGSLSKSELRFGQIFLSWTPLWWLLLLWRWKHLDQNGNSKIRRPRHDGICHERRTNLKKISGWRVCTHNVWRFSFHGSKVCRQISSACGIWTPGKLQQHYELEPDWNGDSIKRHRVKNEKHPRTEGHATVKFAAGHLFSCMTSGDTCVGVAEIANSGMRSVGFTARGAGTFQGHKHFLQQVLLR